MFVCVGFVHLLRPDSAMPEGERRAALGDRLGVPEFAVKGCEDNTLFNYICISIHTYIYRDMHICV